MLKTIALDTAPIHPDVAEGPSDVRAYWVLADDSVRLRVAHWPTEKSSKGTVFLFQGRTENIEKYGRTVEYLHRAGYTAFAVDWRGQGLSDKVAPRKLTITSVLQFLWHEADLGKWYPRMKGKRYWGVIHYALRQAAAAKIVKGQDLARILYVPEYFKPENKAEIAARRNRLFANLRPTGRGATPFGLVIAEYKGMETTAHGARFVFKHAPDCAFFADAELARKFDKVFGDQLRFLEAMGSGHAILIASFSIAKAGYPVLHEIGMMPVTDNWIPFESLRELEVLNALTEQSRAFQKQLRFNLPVNAPIASAVLLDTPDPVAVFVAENPNDAGALALLTTASEDGRYPSWCWFDDGPMRPFPDRGASPSSHRSRTSEGGATGQSVRPSPVNERRASGDERDTIWDSPILPKGASDHG